VRSPPLNASDIAQAADRPRRKVMRILLDRYRSRGCLK
jgi:hypothetical protein